MSDLLSGLKRPQSTPTDVDPEEDLEPTGTSSEQEDLRVAPAEPRWDEDPAEGLVITPTPRQKKRAEKEKEPVTIPAVQEPVDVSTQETDEGKIDVIGSPEEQARRTEQLLELPSQREQGAQIPAYGSPIAVPRSGDQGAIDISAWAETEGALPPADFYRYLQERGRAQGLTEPPMKVLLNGNWSDRTVNPQQLSGGLDMSGHIASGDAYGQYGPEWVEWYKKISEPMATVHGTEQQDLEQYLPNLPPAPEDRPLGTLSNDELIEKGGEDAYFLLAARGAIDTKATGRLHQDILYVSDDDADAPPAWHEEHPELRPSISTAEAMKYAFLLKRRGRTDFLIRTFLREAGVTEEEESVFNRLLAAERSKLGEVGESVAPVGRRGTLAKFLATKEETQAAYEEMLAKSKESHSPEQSDAIKGLDEAKRLAEKAATTYENKVQTGKVTAPEKPKALVAAELIESASAISSLGRLAGGIAGDTDFGRLLRAADAPERLAGGSTTRRGEKGKAPVQGTAGGTDDAALIDLERLAIDRVNLKTRKAAARLATRDTNRKIQAAEASLPAGKLEEMIDFAKEKLPEIATAYKRAGGSLDPVQWQIPDARKEIIEFYKGYGYGWSEAYGGFLLENDAERVDKQAAELRRLYNKKENLDADLEQLGKALKEMGGA